MNFRLDLQYCGRSKMVSVSTKFKLLIYLYYGSFLAPEPMAYSTIAEKVGSYVPVALSVGGLMGVFL